MPCSGSYGQNTDTSSKTVFSNFQEALLHQKVKRLTETETVDLPVNVCVLEANISPAQCISVLPKYNMSGRSEHFVQSGWEGDSYADSNAVKIWFGVSIYTAPLRGSEDMQAIDYLLEISLALSQDFGFVRVIETNNSGRSVSVML